MFESSVKIILKLLRSFLSSGQNTVHQRSKGQIWPKWFFDDNVFVLKIEQRLWPYRVCLVKARRTMYNLTLKGQGQNLTSGQVRARSLGDPSRPNYTSFDAPCGDKRHVKSHLDLKLLAKNYWWPRVTSMTFRGVTDEKFHFEYQQIPYMMRFHSYKLKMKHKTGSLIFAHWLIMGSSRKWPDLRSHISKIRDIHFVGTDDLIIFRKFHDFPSNTVAGTRL